ncbi:MAG: ATP-binding cassette domain-containing protein [Blautia sp.]
MGRKILEIEAVTKKYKEFTLEPVSFSLEAGSSMGVMGAYGSGKTTLLKILTGQIRPEAGTVKFFGKETGKDKSEMLEYCGIVPAEGGFPDCLNTKEINKILKGCYKNWQEACFFELADRFSLSLTRPLKELTREQGRKCGSWRRFVMSQSFFCWMSH